MPGHSRFTFLRRHLTVTWSPSFAGDGTTNLALSSYS
jgi:hypothetical protein